LDLFGAVFHIEISNLKEALEKLNGADEDSKEAAAEVSVRINRIESVAGSLFKK